MEANISRKSNPPCRPKTHYFLFHFSLVFLSVIYVRRVLEHNRVQLFRLRHYVTAVSSVWSPLRCMPTARCQMRSNNIRSPHSHPSNYRGNPIYSLKLAHSKLLNNPSINCVDKNRADVLPVGRGIHRSSFLSFVSLDSS